jgi:TolB protein
LRQGSLVKTIACAAVLAAAFTWLVALPLSDRAGAAFPGQDGRIVFTGYSGGHYGALYSINADGSDRRLLGHGLSPTYSADGTTIAYVKWRRRAGGSSDIYLMRADGSHKRRLTHGGAADKPAFSPSGKRIAFEVLKRGRNPSSIYAIDADGSHRHRLTWRGWNSEPTYSPSGRRIAFTRLRNTGDVDIYSMRPDGSDQRRLSRAPVFAPDGFDYSPDGKRIVFDDGYSIHEMNADGSHRRRLTSGPGDIRPAYSPSGAQIVFERGGRPNLMTMDADGTDAPPRAQRVASRLGTAT